MATAHTLEFREFADGDGVMLSLADYNFALMHLTNPEVDEALESWTAEKTIDRVIGLTGGAAPKPFERFGLPVIAGVFNSNDVISLRWSNVSMDFNGSAAELVRVLLSGVVLLQALAILCQGYLAAHTQLAESPRSESFLQALDKMGWRTDLVLDIAASEVARTESPDFWLVPLCQPWEDIHLESAWRRVEETLQKEWGRSAIGWNEFQTLGLLRAVFTGTLSPDVVAKAYLVLAARIAI